MYGLGTIIGGKYRLAEMIGQGGMASVWRAVHVDLDRAVAVKLLTTRGPDREEQTQRFLDEARVAAKVRHRNVVDIIDFGMHEDQPYMVMELLVGMDLAERITDGAPFAVPEFLRLVNLVLGGLAAVHDAGIIHRDLKPENVFLVEDSDGVFPKLLDFGISRMAPGARRIGSAIPTEEGVIVGTPEYMAPEQARGLRNIDKRADIYCMAVVVYEVLTGRLPFWSENVGDLIVMITTGSAPTLAALRPELGQPLSDVLERAMARNPDQRFESARDFRQAMMEASEKTAEVSNTWARALTTRAGIGSSRRISVGDGAQDPLNPSALTPAVPGSRARVPADSVITLPLPRRGEQRWILMGVGVAVAALAVSLSLDLSAPSANTIPEDGSTAEASLTKAQVELLTVQLDGVPPNARVLLDGVPVPELPIRLPRDEALHDIEVMAEGMQPWRIKHRANASGSYRVAVTALQPSNVENEEARTPSAARRPDPDRATRRGSGAGSMRRQPAMMDGLFRNPGF